jgi:hypothetical protein
LLTSQMSSAETSSTTVCESVCCWTMLAEIRKTKKGSRTKKIVELWAQETERENEETVDQYQLASCQILTFLRGRVLCVCVRERERERDRLQCKTQAQLHKLEWELWKKGNSLILGWVP